MTEKAKQLGEESIISNVFDQAFIGGLTKREYFAAMAMQIRIAGKIPLKKLQK